MEVNEWNRGRSEPLLELQGSLQFSVVSSVVLEELLEILEYEKHPGVDSSSHDKAGCPP